MVERSSTTVIHNVGSRSDRAIGAAVTVGVGVILAQFAARYLRQDSESWLDSILDAIKSWMDGDEKQSGDLVIHSAACHCRSVVFEVSEGQHWLLIYRKVNFQSSKIHLQVT